jgi:hypothetical protein
METVRVGLLGATSLVGDEVLSQLRQAYTVVPFLRSVATGRVDNSDTSVSIPYAYDQIRFAVSLSRARRA